MTSLPISSKYELENAIRNFKIYMSDAYSNAIKRLESETIEESIKTKKEFTNNEIKEFCGGHDKIK